MRRTVSLVGLLILTIAASGCACFVALVGQDVYHDHQDGGVVGGTKAMNRGAIGSLNPYWVGEFRAEKVWEGSYALNFLGGVRLQNDTRLKWPYFWEVTGGLTHYPGQNVATVHPNFGMLFPKAGRGTQFFFRVGLPIYFYGPPKIGTEFTVGWQLSPKK